MQDMRLTLFDLDGTLIPTDSDHAFGDFLVHQGWVDADHFKRRNDAFYADYQAGCLDLQAYIEFATAGWRTRPLADQYALRAQFMAEVMTPMIHPQAQQLVRQHQEAGDRVAIVTATNEFVTQPIAQAFGVDTLIAVRLARDAQGLATGAIDGIPTFREGKITRVEAWLSTLGIDNSRTTFSRITVYSDSINDLPLLEWATHPVATNPAPSLEAIAQERAWPILRLFS